MRKSLVKILIAVTALALSASVQALGMGGINVTSALGQPLQADIELVAVGKAERDSLAVRLASAEAYKNAGLEFPYGNKIKFHIESRADGEPYVQVSSEQPINEPFVSLLVELTWSSGKLLREYTFLLDPPGYAPEQPAQPDVQAVAPTVPIDMPTPEPLQELPSWGESSGQIPPIQPESAPLVQPTDSVTGEPATSGEPMATPEGQIPAEATPVEIPVPMESGMPEAAAVPLPEAEPLPNLSEWLTVPRGSTMYELATQYKMTEISVERMLVALYRANADEFDGRNMNRIRAGKVLRLPDDEAVMDVSQHEAEEEIRVQAADWNAYRQKLAGAASVSAQPQASQQVAVGKISSSVLDKAPVAKESAKEVLKLSKGEAPGDQAAAAAGGKGLSEQDRINAAQEEVIAKAKAVEEERMRAAMLEKNIRDMQLLAQLKSEQAKSSGPGESKAEPAPVVPPVVKVESAIELPVKAPQPEENLLDQILAEPIYLAGGAIALFGFVGLGVVLIRRKKKSSEEADTFEDVGEITGRIATPVVPSPDTGDFTQTVVTSAAPGAKAQSQEPENVDPISEADLFLSFGRDGQAEEILKDALKTMPSNHQIHLKLLGIYSSRQDADAFGSIARMLKDSGDEYAWEQAVEMGRKLEPNNPLYGGAGSMEATGSATVQMMAADTVGSGLDFDLNLNAAPGAGQSPVEQNLLGDMESTMVLTSSALASDLSGKMDFDITSTQSPVPGQGGADTPDEMIFDVTGSHSAASKLDGDGGMAFTLDFPVEQPAKPAPEPAGGGLAGISLNFDESTGASSSGGKDEHWQEVATKLDLAKAYQEMGDSNGALEILDEVMREGDEEQRQAAKTLIAQLG